MNSNSYNTFCSFIRKAIQFVVLAGCVFSHAQDLNMQNGTFTRCAPDQFFDSGGEFGNYSSNEDFTITICPENPGEIIILDFTRFSTQLGDDVMTIYDGSTTADPVVGNFSGTVSPGRIVASSASGCFTIMFRSNGFGNTIGWAANIECATPCQTITPSIDSTVPVADPVTGQISILPGQTVTFNGSAVFSDTGVNATYFWDFATGATANTPITSHQFTTPGTYNVQFTVSDDNPLGCSETVSILVFVGDSIVTINNTAFPESLFSPSELIENVLVSGGCSAVDNFEYQVRGQPNETTTKSYGYFFRGGAVNFPFESGIVISSGTPFLGGNTPIPGVNSGTNGLGGDTDLETALSTTGTQDATFIKFNFIPTSNNISFRYIMASEEYNQNDECNFSDGFAFLLREVGTTTYENLAVLPDGTPVDVTNINGINCPSVPLNPGFFQGYNLGDTNYGGRTVILTASANVVPNTVYEIKLVVADEGDNLFDTTIFIEAGSFNLGGDLGDDITLANGNASCGGEVVTLDTQAPNASHTWFFNGTEIPGETGSTLDIDEAGTYSVEVEFAIGCTTNDSIIVEFRNSPEIEASPINLAGCSPTGIAVFNLAQNTPIVFGSQDSNEFSLTYHTTQLDADTGNNPITNLTNYNGSDGEIIYIRIVDIATETCIVTSNFTLNVFSTVTSEDVTYELCDNDADGDDTNGIRDFDLSAINNQVLGTQDPTQFSVSYHSTLNDADLGTNALPNMFSNTVQNVIYARVQNNSNIDCYATSMITLQVNSLPVINDSVELFQCDLDTDGITNFNLTEANDLISVNAANETFTYHLNMADADTGNNAIANTIAYPNTDPSSNPDILFVRVENANQCYRIAQLELFVSTTQIPPGFSIAPYIECDDTRVDNNITDGITVFDFSDATAQIEAIFPAGQDITVTYYETPEDALSEENQIPDISNHINSASPFNQTIIFRVDGTIDNDCQGFGEIMLQSDNPMPNTNITPIVLCDDVTIGDLVETFDLTQREGDITGGDPNLGLTYYLSNATALIGGTPDITDPTAYQNTNPTETIYVRVTDINTGCFAIVTFDITVNPLPDVISVEPLEECENATDGIFDFDLGPKRDEILNGRDPAIFNITFHISQQDADNLTNPQPDNFTNTVNPQEIFFAITNTNLGCSNSTGSFFVEVLEGAQANSDGEPLEYELCDDNILNDGVAQFDLTLLEDEILDGQDPNDYTIEYYFTEPEAVSGTTTPLPTLYENVANPQTIYVRVSNNLNPDICFEVEPIFLQVNPIPVFDIDDQYILCLSSNENGVVPVPPEINTGLSPTDYEFVWSLNGMPLPGETDSSLIPMEGGIYSVEAFDITTSTITRCSYMEETEVIESDIPFLTVEVTSQAFAGNHVVEATASGNSNYEFSLDNGPWQDTGIFENVSPGEHIMYARDVNGCGIVSDTVLVMDYPLYFTPNGDGNHDSWNIIGIETQPSAKIYIFDRYGKLLKQLSPTSLGWDGTYQGSIMPTDDYWFVVEYTEPLTGETKQQRAHFTLKR